MQINRRLLAHIYMVAFLFYLIIPLVIMAGAAFNDRKLPTIVPWRGLPDRWLVDLWNDKRIWTAFRNTILVALAVAALSVPIGTASAILINSISGRLRSALYGLMVAPILAPGAVIGIGTLLFWDELSVP